MTNLGMDFWSTESLLIFDTTELSLGQFWGPLCRPNLGHLFGTDFWSQSWHGFWYHHYLYFLDKLCTPGRSNTSIPSDMKISEARRLQTFLECEPETQPHQWVRSGRSTHGGGLSESLFYFILTNKAFFDLHSNDNRHHAVLELGSGRGLFSVMASAISPKARTVIAVEVDQERVGRMEQWIRAIRSNDSVDVESRYRLPVLCHGDFCGSTIRPLDRAIRGRRVMIYCNNAGQVWSGDIQTNLEKKLGDCKLGSILISLDKFFSHDTSWR